jgi:hypothetical protein
MDKWWEMRRAANRVRRDQKPFKVQRDARLTPSPCTNCGKVLDAANAVKESLSKRRRVVMPSPGDITVCISCGHVMAFDDDLKLRDLTAAEIAKIAGDRRLLAIQWARGKVKDK